MARLRISAAVLALVSAWVPVDARAADVMPAKAAPGTSTKPLPCTDPWDFVSSDCQLSWYGITIFGTIDAGFGWQSSDAPWDPRSAVGASYPIQKQDCDSVRRMPVTQRADVRFLAARNIAVLADGGMWN